MDWHWIALALAVAWGLQALLTYRQIAEYRRTLRQLCGSCREGYLGVGVQRRRLGAGAVVLLLADPSGRVMDGRVLSGVSVLARFRPLVAWNGHAAADVVAQVVALPRPSAVDLAAAEAARQILLRMGHPGVGSALTTSSREEAP